MSEKITVKDIVEIYEKTFANAEYEVLRGKWLNVEHAPNNLYYATCAVCGKRQTLEALNFCPNCGAQMDLDETYCYEDCVIYNRDLNCERCNK